MRNIVLSCLATTFVAANGFALHFEKQAKPLEAGVFLATPVSSPVASRPRGAIDPRVNQSNIDQTICVPGYAHSVRPSYSITGPLKRQLMRSEHPGERYAGYELDHLVPLSLGGAPDSPQNLWLEPRGGAWNAGDKDQLEFVLWRLVCRHEVPLTAAQRDIAGDWTAAYRRYATPANLARFHFQPEN